MSITSFQLTAALSFFSRSMAGPISTYPKAETAHCSCACLLFVLTQHTHIHTETEAVRSREREREKSLKCRAARQLGKSEKRHPQNETDIHIIIIRVFTLASLLLHLRPDLCGSRDVLIALGDVFLEK